MCAAGNNEPTVHHHGVHVGCRRRQQDLLRVTGGDDASRSLRNQVNATDTLNWDTNGSFLGPTGARTTQTYRLTGEHGCWDRTITAADQKLTSVKGGAGCEDQ